MNNPSKTIAHLKLNKETSEFFAYLVHFGVATVKEDPTVKKGEFHAKLLHDGDNPRIELHGVVSNIICLDESNILCLDESKILCLDSK